jgi:hypothetical protein
MLREIECIQKIQKSIKPKTSRSLELALACPP